MPSNFDFSDEPPDVPIIRNEARPRRYRQSQGAGMAVASLVLGIVGIVFVFCFWPVGIICGILALVFGLIHYSQDGNGMAVAGIVLGIASIALTALFIFGALAMVRLAQFN